MKKLLAVFLAVSMFFGCLTGFAYNFGGELEVAEYGYMSQSNVVIKAIGDEAAIKGYAKIINSASQDTGFAITIAHYDKTDRLLAVKAKQVTISEDIYETTVVSPSLDVTGGIGSYFKLYITKDLSGIKPLASVDALIVTGKSDGLKLSYNVIESVTDDSDYNTVADGYITLQYWANKTDRKPTSVTIAQNPKVYVNGGLAGNRSAIAIRELANFYGYVTLMKENSSISEDYDTINIESYQTLIVDENYTTRYRITSKSPIPSISYDPEDTTISATLYDENGNEMAWKDLKEFDVVSIKEYSNGTTTIITGEMLTDNTVVGTVSGITDEGTYDVLYTINNKTYGIDPQSLSNNEISLGAECTFYLDIMGNITYYEAKKDTINYAYVINIGSNGNTLEPRTALKLYTSNNEYKTFETSAKVTVDGVTGIESQYVDDATIAVSMNPVETAKLIAKQGTGHFVFDNGAYNSYFSQMTGIVGINAGDIIKYKTDQDGRIAYIDRAEAVTSVLNTDGKFTEYTSAAGTMEYKLSSNTLTTNSGRVYLTENTKIMVAPTLDMNGYSLIAPFDLTEEDVGLVDISKLTDQQQFVYARAFNVDDEKNVDFILVETEVDGAEIITPADDSLTVLSEEKYAYVINVGSNGNTLEPKTALKLYTSDNEYKVFETAVKVTVDGVSGIESDDVSSSTIPVSKSAVETAKIVAGQGTAHFVIDGSNEITGIVGINAGDIIKYKTDQNGRIAYIDRAEPVTSVLNTDGKFTEYVSAAGTTEYSSSENALYTYGGQLYITDNTRIMVAPIMDNAGEMVVYPYALTEEDVGLVDITKLTDEHIFYNARAFNVDDEKNVDFILVQTEVDGAEIITPADDSLTVLSEEKYGYVIQLGSNGNTLEPRTALKLYTSDNEYKTFETSAKVTVDGVTGIESRYVNNATIAVSKNPVETTKLIAEQGTAHFVLDSSNTITGIVGFNAGDIIKYKTDQNGRIAYIDRAEAVTSVSNTDGKFTEYVSAAGTMEYSSSENAFYTYGGRVYLTENTKIIVAPTMDESGMPITYPSALTQYDFAMFDTTNIADEQQFVNARAFNVDVNNNVEFILVETEVDIVEPASNMTLVSGYGSANNAAGDPIYTIRGLRNGEEQTLLTNEDDLYGIEAYSTIVPKFDTYGNIKGTDVLATLSWNGNFSVDFYEPYSSNKINYYYGQVTDRTKHIYTTFNGNCSEIFVPGTANVYVYDSGASVNNKVSIEDYAIIESDNGDIYLGNDYCTSVYAIAREYDGEVVDVVLYIFR